MPPRPPILCQVCGTSEFKYTCVSCSIVYCSVPCYKEHTRLRCKPNLDQTGNLLKHQIGLEPDREASRLSAPSESVDDTIQPDEFRAESQARLRPLTSLKWPNVPPPPAIVDPLTIHDPKPLQLVHYEAIATSAELRTLLDDHPVLRTILRELDRLSGLERERALEAILGVESGERSRPSKGSLSWMPQEVDEEEFVVLRSFVDKLGKLMATNDVQAGSLDGTLALETTE